MNKTKIPWADYTINPVKGLCPMACPYCYARRMYKRFKWDQTIRYDYHAFDGVKISLRKNSSRIFVGSTMELFGDWVKREWMQLILDDCRFFDNHTFIFLTKQPQNLIRWSPFPYNCWIGVSVTSAKDAIIRIPKLKDIIAPIKFISFEPLLKPIAPPNQLYNILKLSGIKWLILGSRTQPTQHPPREWVDEIITAADKASIPVFVKEPMASYYNIHRQEFPR